MQDKSYQLSGWKEYTNEKRSFASPATLDPFPTA